MSTNRHLGWPVPGLVASLRGTVAALCSNGMPRTRNGSAGAGAIRPGSLRLSASTPNQSSPQNLCLPATGVVLYLVGAKPSSLAASSCSYGWRPDPRA
jgi:hypothetical protein